MIKTCSKCSEEKDASLFVRDGKSKDLLSWDCKDCRKKRKDNWDANNKDHKATYKKGWVLNNKSHIKQYEKENIEQRRVDKKKYMQKHRDINPDIYNSKEHKTKMRSHTLKYKYGLTVEDYNIMMFEQDGKCGICNKHQTECKSVFVVDHCHKSGKLRKLLCRKCNALLGMCDDNVDVLESAIRYLK